jgi:hypothetical protein
MSHVEGSAVVMSAGESDSESDDQIEQETEVTETPYIHTPEDEFGAVSCNQNLLDYKLENLKLKNLFHGL